MRKYKCKYDWEEIQKYNDDGHTWREIKEHYGCSDGAISKALNRGVLKLRNKIDATKLASKKGRKFHTEETKKKTVGKDEKIF